MTTGINPTDPSGQLAADAAALDRIRLQARTDPQGAARAAAREFEAMFLGMLLKSMRDTTAQDTYFDSTQTRFFQSLLDQQYAQVLAARGTGLAEVLARQLTRELAPAAPPGPAAQAPAVDEAAGPAAAAGAPAPAQEFANRVWPHALSAARETGVAPHFIVAQAALESGWGRAEIRYADGSPSYNLFGIKAGRGWRGPVVEAPTTEYVNGVAQPAVERFRAYGSYAEAFLDYARLLRSQPRYAAVLENGTDAAGFARGLAQGGYATDPMYAEKLLRIINGPTLRTALTG